MIKKVERIYDKISKLKLELKEIQDSCEHKNKIKNYRADTGNYDPREDNYWCELYCPDCDKKWSVTDNDPEYRS